MSIVSEGVGAEDPLDEVTEAGELEQEVTLLFSLERAEELVEMLDRACCRMRDNDRPRSANIELTVALPIRVVEALATED